MRCPRCGFDQDESRADCARCGVVFAKIATPARPRPRRGTVGSVDSGVMEAPTHRVAFWARATLLLLLAVKTIGFLRHGMDPTYLMDSFLHLVNLPFHEAGHVLFMPFGRFLMTLGGSLLQLLIPLLCAGVFLVRNREPFSASVGLWWFGQSLMDLAPYIADARALRLPLLGGQTGAEVEGHDWEYLLTTLGWLRHDVTLGKLAFALGALIMLASLTWGAMVLARQYRLIAPREAA